MSAHGKEEEGEGEGTLVDLIREEMRNDFFDLHEMEAFADEEEEIPEDIVGLADEKNVTLIDTIIWYTELAVRGFPMWGLRKRREEGLTLVESLEGRRRRVGCQQARNFSVSEVCVDKIGRGGRSPYVAVL